MLTIFLERNPKIHCETTVSESFLIRLQTISVICTALSITMRKSFLGLNFGFELAQPA